ncbi:hypothetical protein BC628DRAFT_1534852, partial [Trametes gibbosa]
LPRARGRLTILGRLSWCLVPCPCAFRVTRPSRDVQPLDAQGYLRPHSNKNVGSSRLVQGYYRCTKAHHHRDVGAKLVTDCNKASADTSNRPACLRIVPGTTGKSPAPWDRRVL